MFKGEFDLKYTTENIINTLTKNLGFSVVDDAFLGTLVELNNYDAYKYCVITGQGYLKEDEPEKRFILTRDYFRVFNQAMEYELQFGIFDEKNISLFETPHIHIEQFPRIIEGSKFIAFVEYKNNKDLLKKLDDIIQYIKEKGDEPGDYIICPVRLGKLVDFEPFFEYVVTEIFNRMGYITDNQIPFFYGVGTPDCAVYELDNLVSSLSQYTGLNGFSIFELSLVNTPLAKFKIKHTPLERINNFNAMVGEVKTGSVDGSQIKKYIDREIFDEAVEIIPHKKDISEYAGLINFNEDGKVVFNMLRKQKVDKFSQESYINWLIDYMKYYILASYTDEEFIFFKDKYKLNSINFVEEINRIDIVDLASIVYK